MPEPRRTEGEWLVGGPYPSVCVCYVAESGYLDADGGEPPRYEQIAKLHDYIDGQPPDEVVANARFIAMCGTVAHAIDKQRYDGEEAIRRLPEILRSLELASRNEALPNRYWADKLIAKLRGDSAKEPADDHA